jgi:hypothetical protein
MSQSSEGDLVRGIHVWPSALALALAAACGGSGHNPVAAGAVPTPPAPAMAQFVNGLNADETVPGLLVAVDGVALTQPTGSDGRTAGTVPNGARVTTSGRTDFLDRDTRFSVQAPRLPLWPLTSTYGAEYVRALVYDYAGGEEGSTQWDNLMRPRPATYTVAVDATLRNDAVAYYWVNVALEEVMLITHGKVTFSWVETGGDVTFEVNPDYPGIEDARGLCDQRFSGRFITGARIVLRSLAMARSNTVVHELGHFLGFQHSSDSRDLMSVGHRNYQQVEFTSGEESTWLMMAQREAGNLFPDRDAGLAGAGGRPSPPPIVCGY